MLFIGTTTTIKNTKVCVMFCFLQMIVEIYGPDGGKSGPHKNKENNSQDVMHPNVKHLGAFVGVSSLTYHCKNIYIFPNIQQ